MPAWHGRGKCSCIPVETMTSFWSSHVIEDEPSSCTFEIPLKRSGKNAPEIILSGAQEDQRRIQWQT
jgi:hypothetical protein